jgi:hypothetical protein
MPIIKSAAQEAERLTHPRTAIWTLLKALAVEWTPGASVVSQQREGMGCIGIAAGILLSEAGWMLLFGRCLRADVDLTNQTLWSGL